MREKAPLPTLDWGLIALPRQEKTRRVFALGRAFAFGLSLTWTAIVPAAFAADQDTPAPASTPAKPKAQPQQAPAKPAAPKPQAQATPAKPAAEAQKAQAQTTAAPAKPVAKTAAKKPAPKKPVVAAKAAPKKLVPPVRDAGAARPLAVSRIGPEAPMLNAHDKELFGAAMRAAAKHQWPAAAVGVAGLRNPVLRKVVDWAMLIDPGPHANFTQRTAFMAANPQWPQQADLRRLAENTIDSSVPAAAITYWFDKTPPVLTSGKVAYARALLAQGRVPDATKVARDAWITGVFDANDEREFLRDFSGVLSPADYWARTDRILYDEQTSAANRIMVRLDDDHARLARARIGLIGGAGNVDALIRDVPQALQGDPGLLYDRVRWRRQRDNGDGVFDLVPQFGEPGARPDLWWRQRFNLVREALSKGRISEAYTIAKNHGMTEPTAVAEAEWLAGWISFRFLKDAETALAHFERVYDTGRVPQDLSRGAYWTGRAAESLGRADIASNWYQRAATYITTYYGQLALSRMGTDIAIPQLPPDPQPTAEERAAFEAKDLTQALRALLEVDAKEFQWVFASALAQSSGLAVERQMVDEMLSRHARPDLGIMLARSAAREKIDLIEYGYPVPPYGYPGAPDKALILAITRQESNFDPGAMSYVGARGLMQLMPDTAKALAKTANVPYVRAKLVTDPAYNLKLGSTYLASLLNSFEGSYILTAAAYNAGPGRARQWVRQFGDPQDANVDAIDWVEQIPFNETRAYVQRVMENMMIYRAVLAGTSKIPPTLERELARRQPQVAQNH